MGRWCSSLWLLMQILLYTNQVEPSHVNNTINIGYLLQDMDVAGAINVAIGQAQNDGLLPDYNFRYHYCYLWGIVFCNTIKYM